MSATSPPAPPAPDLTFADLCELEPRLKDLEPIALATPLGDAAGWKKIRIKLLALVGRYAANGPDCRLWRDSSFGICHSHLRTIAGEREASS